PPSATTLSLHDALPISFTTDNEVNSRRINPTNLQIAETWRAFYRVIARANFILDALPSIDLTEERKNRISGEARFMRAYMYSEIDRKSTRLNSSHVKIS